MARAIEFGEGEFYHVFNRGIEQRDIFIDEDERARFQKLLYLCNGTTSIDLRRLPTGVSAYETDPGVRLVDIGAYCLMTNHFHLLLRELREGGISKFMHKLGTALTMYFNTKHSRKGRLFESTFKAVHAKDDRHLKYLFAYIHLNPTAFLSQAEVLSYPYSSCLDYSGPTRLESKIITPNAFPTYFDSPKEFLNELNEWIDYAEAKPPQEGQEADE